MLISLPKVTRLLRVRVKIFEAGMSSWSLGAVLGSPGLLAAGSLLGM